MLTTLHVQNLVVVREIEIEFRAGLTVLTGETGAGKSILIEALSLALGERADSQLIRHGCERAVISASFDIENQSGALNFLREHALDDGTDCILRRVLSSDGRSRAFCNSTPITLSMLRELASYLIDIHIQHAGQRLLQREVQRQLLDGYGDLQTRREAVSGAFEAWKALNDKRVELEAMESDSARIELVRYQLEELNNAKLDVDELDSIESEYRKLANSHSNQDDCATIRAALVDEQVGAGRALEVATACARGLSKTSAQAMNLATVLEQADVAVREALTELDSLESDLKADPQRLHQIDQRLAELHGLARKHHVGLAELADTASALADELERFDLRFQSVEELQVELQKAHKSYQGAAASLSTARRKTAKKMDKDITARMRELGIPHAVFSVCLSNNDNDIPTHHGQDRVEFRVSTNPEQAPGALNKVASGGELSRITLAIQAATALHSGVQVSVYDEVDTGIGGNTANIVGRSLRDVAEHNQVLCITHSPQVASAGEHHLLVEKRVVEGRSETSLCELNTKAREQEIARMLGAAQNTRSSLAHARDLLTTARS